MRRSWLRLALTWLVVWVLGFRLLQGVWPYANRWLLFSGLTLAYCLWLLWRYLPENHRAAETALLPRLGLGNRLTLLRGLAIALLAGFLFAPWPQGALAWVIALLYTLASSADYFDGAAARKTNHATQLGSRLDMEFDALGVAVVSLLAVWYGQVPWWFLGVGLARYGFVAGLAWRRRRHLPVADLAPSIHRRIFAGVFMAMLTVVLWPIVPAAMTTIAGSLLAFFMMVGFGRDWLLASGRLDAHDPAYRRVQSWAWRLLGRRLPLLWRALIVVCMGVILITAVPWQELSAWADLINSWALPGALLLAQLLTLVGAAGAILAALGCLARVAAIFLLFPIGFSVATAELGPANGIALVAALCLVLFGAGPFALWMPEDGIFVRRGAALSDGDGGIVTR